MLTEAHYKAALNYFYFLLLDEGAALHSALRAIKLVQKSQKKEEKIKTETLLARSLSQVLAKARGNNWRPGSNPPKSDWKTPQPEVLASWKEYMRHSDIQSAEAMVFRYILNYSVDVIADALELPEGTVIFRLGRGLEGFMAGRRK